jgi:hypothetical protein
MGKKARLDNNLSWCSRLFIQTEVNGFMKSPDAALRCIFRHCSVRQVRCIPQDLHALPADFLQSRPNFDIYEIIKFWWAGKGHSGFIKAISFF